MYGNRIEAKIRAKSAIKGAFIVFFFIGLLIGLPSGVIGSIRAIMNKSDTSETIKTAVSLICSLLSIAINIFIIPLQAGLSKKYLALAKGEDSRAVSVLCYYREKDWEEKIKAYILIYLYAILGFILLIVPGIIIILKYSVIGFVFAENPKISYREAMKKCNEITFGRKFEIFAFHLSFIGWHILAVFTLGILEVWLIPYQNTAFAVLYDLYRPIPEQPLDSIFTGYNDDFRYRE